MTHAIAKEKSSITILQKLNLLEEEISNLRLIFYNKKMPKKKKVKSLEGMGKLISTEEELVKSIEAAKKSLFKLS